MLAGEGRYLGSVEPCVDGGPVRPYSAKFLHRKGGKRVANFKAMFLNQGQLREMNRGSVESR